MLAAFLAWWLRQLSELLPAGLRRRRSREIQPDGLLLTLLDDAGSPAVQATRRSQRRTTQLGRFAADASGLSALRTATGAMPPRSIRLVLPPHLLLQREVSLPLAAEQGLATALRWEMDRLTPFSADAVFWHWRVERRDRQRGTIAVSLALVPKAAVASVVTALKRAGLTPATLASATDPAATVPLAPSERLIRSRPSWEPMLGTAVLAATLGSVVMPFAQQARELRNYRQQETSLRPQVEVAETLRRRLSDRAATDNVLAQETVRIGDVLQVLASVTDILPDDTYLSQLGLRNRALTMTGESRSAARLIALMAGDPALQSPTFSAPVTRNEATKLESFSVRAETRR